MTGLRRQGRLSETCGARTLGPHWICARFAATALCNRPLARVWRSPVLPPRATGRGSTRHVARVSHLAVSLAGAQAVGRRRGRPRRSGGAPRRSGLGGLGAHAARLRLRLVRASLSAPRARRLLRSPRTASALDAPTLERLGRSPEHPRAEGFVIEASRSPGRPLGRQPRVMTSRTADREYRGRRGARAIATSRMRISGGAVRHVLATEKGGRRPPFESARHARLCG